MREMKRKMVCMGLCFALTSALLTACGSEETAGEEVRGRVTSISDTEITLEITAHQDGERPDKKDFGGAIRKDDMASETKTYSISTSTKFYTQQGEEKTEISSADVELGAMVTVTVSGDEAESITVQTRSQRNSENAEA